MRNLSTFAAPYAGVVKLVDTLDLGSSAARLGGSSPSARTGILSAGLVSAVFLTTKETSTWLR